MPGKGSVTRSVRIEKDADQHLRELAGRGETSVNTLVNRALRKFVEWDAYGDKFGFITMPGVILIRLMDYLSEDEAKDLGAWAGRTLLREYITFWFKEITPETFLHGFPTLFAKYGRTFAYEEHVEDHRRTIIVNHGGGMKWSVFYEELIRTGFRELLNRDVRIEKTGNQVVVRIQNLGDGLRE